MTLTELAQKVYNARSLPGELAELHITLASMYSTESEKMMEVQLKKADFWQVKDIEGYEPYEKANPSHLENPKGIRPVMREKPLSDTAVEMLWLQTEEGKKEIKLKYTLRSIEKLMSAVKSSMVNSAIEAKNI